LQPQAYQKTPCQSVLTQSLGLKEN
jgi:hypothetical protein